MSAQDTWKCYLIKIMTLWLWGGFIYYLIEIAWRGHSHPSMFVTGGICFIVIGGLNKWYAPAFGILWRALIGAIVITVIELAAGIIVNIWLGLNVWDYSDLPLNVLGQICLPYTVLWIPLAIFAVWLDGFLRWKIYGYERRRFTWLAIR